MRIFLLLRMTEPRNSIKCDRHPGHFSGEQGGFIVRIGNLKLPKVSLKDRLALEPRYVVALIALFPNIYKERPSATTYLIWALI